VGAGVVGLAIAAELARPGRTVLVIEKNRTFGLETSSRNSEVIHAGLYYPEGSLKGRLCVEGNRLLYELCREYEVGHHRVGKIIVATNEEEISELEKLRAQSALCGVTDLRLLSREEVRRLEPNVEATAGILSPSTGLVDSHGLMRLFHGLARERGADFAFEAEVTRIERAGDGFEVGIRDREGESSFLAGIVVNSAGLQCEQVARSAGVQDPAYRLHYCKGEYFSLNSPEGPPVSRLVYPLPEHAGKGIHVTVTLDGAVRLGPSAQYVDEIDYTVDETHRAAFHESVRRFLPRLRLEDLSPDFAGVRPKLQGPEDGFRDFVIRHEADRGLPGLISLVGIESPGLTASPAIARYVAAIVGEIGGQGL
jgi:L-2-hydroxyglutarate oxidase LhgO